MKQIRHKRLKISLIVISALIVVMAAAFLIYTADYYRAQSKAQTILADSATLFDGGAAFGDPASQQGLIFYPGAKVEYTAYAPLMQQIAERGIFCVIVKMPFNLAVFDSGAAARIIAKYPLVEQWTIGGHSLGGAMAADYASKNPDKFAGLALFAAYSASDLSQSDFQVISIYGSEDKVLSQDKLIAARKIMPPDYKETIIEGGNHGQFGDYGEQAGDGKATISAEEQWQQTAQAVGDFILR